jgi:hypothetical protein
MRKWLALIFFIVIISEPAHADIDPNQLVKVTPEIKQSCVEYYSYKNAMYCSTKALSAQPVDPNIKDYEHQKIVFDVRPWQAAWGKQTPEMDTVEYVPAGDNIEQWHELVTSQFMPDRQNQFTVQEFVAEFIKGIKESGFQPIVNYIKVTPTQIILEFRITSPNEQIQDELQIITKDDKGLYILHYTIKKSDMGEKNRDIWLNNLKNSRIN